MSLPLNKTELIARCEDLGYLDVHRRMSEDELLELIKAGPFKKRLPILQSNHDRLALMKVISENWELVLPLLSCPARSGSPTACFTCTDLQVGYCAAENSDLLQSVKVTKKELEEMTTKNTLANFKALTAEEWKAIGEDPDKSQRTKLMGALVALGVQPVEATSKYKTVDEKVAKIMELQEQHGYTVAAAPKAGKTAQAKGPAVSKAPAAAQKTAPAAASTGGASVGNADVSALKAEVEELKETVGTLLELVQEMAPFVKDTHAMVRASFALEMMDEEVATSFHGQLLIGGESEGND